MIVLRGVFTLGALAVMVFTRYRIGANTLAPWSNKQYGKMSKDRFKSTAPMRLIMIFLLYIWVKVFWILQMISISDAFLGQKVWIIPTIINNLFKFNYTDYNYPYDPSGSLIDNIYNFLFFSGSFVDATYLYWLSFIIPFVGLFHFYYLNAYDQRGELPDPLSLGRSWFFHDFLKLKDDITIWSFYEPLLVALIGLCLLAFRWETMLWVSIFLWIAALFMTIQGFARHNREQQDMRVLKYSEQRSKRLAEKLKGKSDRSSDDDNIAIPI